MTPDRDEDTGRFSEKYPKEAFLQATRELDIATTSKVAAEVGCSYDLAYRRLQELELKGGLEKEDVGGSFIWKQPESK